MRTFLHDESLVSRCAWPHSDGFVLWPQDDTIHACLLRRSVWRGEWPKERHDGVVFTEMNDRYRLDKIGTPLVRACLMSIRGDWDAFANLLGFLPWSHTSHPCLFCFCSKHTLSMRWRHAVDFICLVGELIRRGQEPDQKHHKA